MAPETVDDTFNLIGKARDIYAKLGCTLPGRWRRSLSDADRAIEMGLRVRVVKGQWAQFGISGDPAVASAWRALTIADDPPRQSNVRGTVTFAFAVPRGRATQVYIALGDLSARQDAQGFVPFGRVVEGMDVADGLNAEYGEAAGGGIRGGRQQPLFEGGNAYLDREFPRLDRIVRASVVGEPGSDPALTPAHERHFIGQ